ncbi:ParB/RepB/Spo0J family partition protein [Streptomyces zhihengii]
MGKADTLGPSNAFAGATRARSARAQLYNAAIGKVLPDADGTLPVDSISQNPDNPRDHMRNLDDMTQTVAEVGVVVPITVATVDAYLAERPERAEDLDPDTQYLVVDGHRRLEASRRVGRERIKVTVDDARVATDEALLEAAFVANYHRDNMTELEEAQALESLVTYYGSQTKAAQRLGIAQATLSSKLSLLKLTPVLQADLAEGRRQLKHVRNLGKQTPEQQIETANARAAADKQEKSLRREAAKLARAPQPAPAPAVSTTSHQAPAAAPVPEPRPEPSPAPQPAAARTSDPAPGPAEALVPQKPQIKMPWDDGAAAMEIAFEKLTKQGQRPAALARYVELAGGLEGFAADLAAAVGSPEDRRKLGELLAGN